MTFSDPKMITGECFCISFIRFNPRTEYASVQIKCEDLVYKFRLGHLEELSIPDVIFSDTVTIESSHEHTTNYVKGTLMSVNSGADPKDKKGI